MGYGTDLRDNEWEILEPLLAPKQKGRPRKHSLRAICNAIRYVQRTGCQWRMLPKDFPPWLVVYMTFWRWRNSGVWERIMHELRCRVRVQAGRNPDPSLAMIDSQSVKTVQKGGSGYDGGKKVKGRKRHIAVDGMGWPLAVAVHSAGISETRGAHLVLIRLFLILPNLLKILLDGGSKQGVIDWGKAMFGYLLEVVKRPELHACKVAPKRWIVERTFGWFNWQRRLAKDYEHNPKTSETMLHFTACTLMLGRLKTL